MALLRKEKKFDALFLGDYEELAKSFNLTVLEDDNYYDFLRCYKLLENFSDLNCHIEDLICLSKNIDEISEDINNFIDDIVYYLSDIIDIKIYNRSRETFILKKFNGFTYIIKSVNDSIFKDIYIFKQNLTNEFLNSLKLL